MIEYVIYGKCKTLDCVPAGAIVEFVDGEKVICFCQNCGAPITGKNQYNKECLFNCCDQKCLEKIKEKFYA